MLALERLNQQLEVEIERVGGGYLKTDAVGFEASCQLFVHEGTELNPELPGSVDWHPWNGQKFPKRALLNLIKRWPNFAGHLLDPRVGIWFNHYKLQQHRVSGALRWKDLQLEDTGYPDILPWHDLERIAIQPKGLKIV